MDELAKRLWECASGECFNCSQYTETTNASVCSKELMKQAADAIEELTDTNVGKWIPVEERLPKDHERVLVVNDDGKMMVAQRAEDDDECESWCVLGPCTDETPSHADKIRRMTDEELADYMAFVGKVNNGCPVMSINCQESCDKCWLDWLKEEADK